MSKPKEVLSPEDYNNYRNVRAVAVLFVVLGGIIFFPGGILMATQRNRDPHRDMHPAVAIGMSIVGLAGVVELQPCVATDVGLNWPM